MLILKETIYWTEAKAKIHILYSDLLDDHIAVFPDKLSKYVEEWAEWFYEIPVYLQSEIELMRKHQPTKLALYKLHEKRKKQMRSLDSSPSL